jgi:hypothetical protein
MKVFGLQGSVYRLAQVASRLTAETSAIAAVRRDGAHVQEAGGFRVITAVLPTLALTQSATSKNSPALAPPPEFIETAAFHSRLLPSGRL